MSYIIAFILSYLRILTQLITKMYKNKHDVMKEATPIGKLFILSSSLILRYAGAYNKSNSAKNLETAPILLL